MKNKLEQRSFQLMLLLITVLFIYLLGPYLTPMFWACAIALIFYPVQSRLHRRFGVRPNTNALLTLLLSLFVAIIPITLILFTFVQEAADLYRSIEKGNLKFSAILERIHQSVPQFQMFIDKIGLDSGALKNKIAEFSVSASRLIAENTFFLGQTTLSFIVNFELMLYLTFYFLRDGTFLLTQIMKALPLGDDRERLLFSKLAEVTRATIKGNFVVAIVQGTLGGIIFVILDIPAPVLWGVLMAVSSLIPAVGAGLVWGPTAIYLFAMDSKVEALVLVLYGVLIIGLADNLLRPLLVGKDTKLPDWLILIATLGGLSWFDIQGFVMGPLIAGLFVVFWQIFTRDFNVTRSLLVTRQGDLKTEKDVNEN